MKNILILLMGLFLLSGCSVFSPVKTETQTTYLINKAPHPISKRANRSINLLVTPPEANSIYNTTDMAYTTQPYQIGYFAKSSWAEPPTQMLQPLIIQTLQKTRYFHSVGSLSTIGQYNYILNTQLLQLQQDYAKFPHVLHFVLRAQIINANTNQVIASKEFSTNEPLNRNDPYSGVMAANKAAATVLNQLAQFCLRMIK
jgi:cholesterol transport system auxiliary component